jgi:hypothetical protein
MEAALTSKTSVDIDLTTRQYILEDWTWKYVMFIVRLRLLDILDIPAVKAF